MDANRTEPVGTILMVDDEAPILLACRPILEREGHTVLTARSGDEALQIAKTHFGRIDLVLTDVGLPEFSGAELYERIRAYRPNALVLYMSGLSEENHIRRGVVDPGATVLEKPFSLSELVIAVRSILSP